MSPRSLDRLAVITPSLVLLCTGLAFFDGAKKTSGIAVAVLASLCLVALLAHAFKRSAEFSQYTTESNVPLIRMYLVAHTIGLTFAAAKLTDQTHTIPDTVWVAGFALLFYTGRHTWKLLESTFKRPIYAIFRRGNTSLLITLPSLSVLSLFLQADALASFVSHALTAYVVIHFALTGVAIACIDRDLSR